MKRLGWVLLAGLLILLVGVGYGVLAWSKRPMSQPLSLHPPTQPAVQATGLPVSPEITATREENLTANQAKPETTQVALPVTAAKTCGNTGSMRLLVVGLTTPTNGEVLGADAIRLVTINFNQPSVSVLSLPAVLWVNTPALADLGIKQIPLTSVYSKAYAGAKDDSEAVRAQKATQTLAQTIVDNFGYMPDHYITLDQGVFIQYVDALGGVEVSLPRAVDGSLEGYGFYPAGKQILDGTRSLNFARLFHPGGITGLDIWGNQERQNLIVNAILTTTLKPENWTKIPGLVNQVHQAVITDLSIDQTLNLVCMAKTVGEKTQMLGISKEMIQRDALGRMVPDGEKVKVLIDEMGSSN